MRLCIGLICKRRVASPEIAARECSGRPTSRSRRLRENDGNGGDTHPFSLQEREVG